MIRLQIHKPYFDLAIKILKMTGFNNITPDTADQYSSTLFCGDVDTAYKAKNILKRERIPSTIIDQTEVQ